MIKSKWFFNTIELCEFCNKNNIVKEDIVQIVRMEKGFEMFYVKR